MAGCRDHDAFGSERFVEGSLRGIERLKKGGVNSRSYHRQHRSTSTDSDILSVSLSTWGSVAHHLFLLVPREEEGTSKSGDSLPSITKKHFIGYYNRGTGAAPGSRPPVLPITPDPTTTGQKEGKKSPPEYGWMPMTRGAGRDSFLFFSHVGQVQPCGYLELDAET